MAAKVGNGAARIKTELEKAIANMLRKHRDTPVPVTEYVEFGPGRMKINRDVIKHTLDAIGTVQRDGHLFLASPGTEEDYESSIDGPFFYLVMLPAAAEPVSTVLPEAIAEVRTQLNSVVEEARKLDKPGSKITLRAEIIDKYNDKFDFEEINLRDALDKAGMQRVKFFGTFSEGMSSLTLWYPSQ